jgi:Trk K+ transport system NAD-binding subunit
MGGLLAVLAVMFVIRPINVFLCTAGGEPTFREKLFLAWVAPRGIVAASVASLGAIVLEQRGYPDAHRVESLVFLTIFMTVFLQGASAKLVGRALGVTVRDARAVLIAGASSLARAVARAYAGAGKQVTLIDRNPALVEEARAEGMRAVAGDATDRATLHLAGIDEADVFVSLTPSSVVNQTAAMVALHESRFDAVRVALDAEERQKLDPILERAGAEVAFAHPFPFGAWLRALAEGGARLVEVAVTDRNRPAAPLGRVTFDEAVLPVLVRHAGELDVANAATRLVPGDRVVLLTRVKDVAALEPSLGVTGPAAGAAGRNAVPAPGSL